MTPELSQLKQTLLSLGKSFFSSRPIYITPKAKELLSQLEPLTIPSSNSSFHIIHNSESYTLEISESGKIPNLFLLPPKSLLICLFNEIPPHSHRLIFPL